MLTLPFHGRGDLLRIKQMIHVCCNWVPFLRSYWITIQTASLFYPASLLSPFLWFFSSDFWFDTDDNAMVTLMKVMLRVIIIMDNDIQTTASLLFPSSLILLPLLTSATLSSLLASTLIALDKMVRPVEIFVFVLFIVVTYFFLQSPYILLPR